MIIIEITNINELVRSNSNWLAGRIGPYVSDVEARGEQEVMAEIISHLQAEGMHANIINVGGVHLRSVDVVGQNAERLVDEGIDPATE